MFTTVNAKKALFTLISTLLAICSFSMFGCSAKLSEQDRQQISDAFNDPLEMKNDRLTKENTELKKKNKNLEEHVSQLTDENTELKKENKNLTDENTELKKENENLTKDNKGGKDGDDLNWDILRKPPDKVFRVGDELPPFTFNDVTDSSIETIIVGGDATYGSGFFFDGIHWVGGILTVHDAKYGPGVIAISDKEAWIELKDGTRYVCLTEGGCIISQKDYTIIRGEIKISYKK